MSKEHKDKRKSPSRFVRMPHKAPAAELPQKEGKEATINDGVQKSIPVLP